MFVFHANILVKDVLKLLHNAKPVVMVLKEGLLLVIMQDFVIIVMDQIIDIIQVVVVRQDIIIIMLKKNAYLVFHRNNINANIKIIINIS